MLSRMRANIEDLCRERGPATSRYYAKSNSIAISLPGVDLPMQARYLVADGPASQGAQVVQHVAEFPDELGVAEVLGRRIVPARSLRTPGHRTQISKIATDGTGSLPKT
jgi:hypothetical protein